LKRTIGLNLFSWLSPGWELFWIRFPNSAGALQTLSEWVEEGSLKTKVQETLPFTDEGVQKAFAALHSRRVVGKMVVRVGKE
jgi:NADPH:quinone reductase-like Zn-dependent oxidoreductase